VCTSCKRRGLRVQISGPRGRKSRPTCRDGKKVSIRWSVYTHLEHFRGAVSSREEVEEGESLFVGERKRNKKKICISLGSRAFDLSSAKLTEIQNDAKAKRERERDAPTLPKRCSSRSIDSQRRRFAANRCPRVPPNQRMRICLAIY